MKLVIGGYAQGKLEYVKQRLQGKSVEIWEKTLPSPLERGKGIVVINHLNDWIRDRLLKGGCPEEEIFQFIRECPGCILISDEVGNGIIPLEKEEREYRERTGKILIALAKEAKEVERILCGISQKIK
jgi:adenosyl cobinamide kinase/adenosyl cobinamide phosphate guanylyltransferase